VRISAAVLALIVIMLAAQLSSGEEVAEYRQFRFDDVSCDAAVSYKTTKEGLNVTVSAIAYGRGAEFRKWAVTDIRLNVAYEPITTEDNGKFFVKKESIFRYPAAVVFAALGTQISASGSGFSQGITVAGATIGLGLLALMAEGDISGERDLFSLNWVTVDKILESRDYVSITVEDTDKHLKKTIKINLTKAPVEESRFDFGNMRQDELLQVMDTLEHQIDSIRNNQGKYKYAIDPEYEEMQKRIESLETERAVAYKTWYERGHKSKF